MKFLARRRQLMVHRRRWQWHNAVTVFTALASTGAEHAQVIAECKAGLLHNIDPAAWYAR
jgi:hypothetical protein